MHPAANIASTAQEPDAKNNETTSHLTSYCVSNARHVRGWHKPEVSFPIAENSRVSLLTKYCRVDRQDQPPYNAYAVQKRDVPPEWAVC
jgi:hypothetical protein